MVRFVTGGGYLLLLLWLVLLLLLLFTGYSYQHIILLRFLYYNYEYACKNQPYFIFNQSDLLNWLFVSHLISKTNKSLKDKYLSYQDTKFYYILAIDGWKMSSWSEAFGKPWKWNKTNFCMYSDDIYVILHWQKKTHCFEIHFDNQKFANTHTHTHRHAHNMITIYPSTYTSRRG